MTEKEKYSIKLAINIMSRNSKKYWNVSYGNNATGVKVSFGEAINILENMIKEEDDK